MGLGKIAGDSSRLNTVSTAIEKDYSGLPPGIVEEIPYALQVIYGSFSHFFQYFVHISHHVT